LLQLRVSALCCCCRPVLLQAALAAQGLWTAHCGCLYVWCGLVACAPAGATCSGCY
jgi:hypothetical protein